MVASLEEEMLSASAAMDFEQAARLRDELVRLRTQLEGKSEEDILGDLKKTARKGSKFGWHKRGR
jgi:excinuclease ABC subunit B